MRMAQEDQTQKCINSISGTYGGGGGGGGGGNIFRSSKKQKPKKVPQRGLGVAQLERIRLEEQQKKDAAIASASARVLPSSSSSAISQNKSSYLSVPTPNYPPSNQARSSSSIPFPADLSSPNVVLRPSTSVQNIETMNLNIVPLTNPVVWPAVSVQGQENVQKLWNSCEYNLEKGISGVDPGSAFRSNLNHLSYESIPIWPLPSLMQRAQHYQHPASSMVNESSATSSSSVLNFQMEPPSNQSYYDNYTPMWPEEEKMVGMKRSYPFSLDNPPGFSSFHCKFPPIVHPRLSRSDDSASCGSGHAFNFELSNTLSREASSCSTFILEPKNSKKSIKDNGILNGGFLTLAPPTTNSMCQGSKLRVKHPPPCLAFSSSEFPDFESLPYQGSVEDQIIQLGPGGSNQKKPFYSFFPQAMAQTGQPTSTMNNCNNVEVGESVDLNLKL